jgi:dihydropteroate synthase
MAVAAECGLPQEKIVLDPGLGFAKQPVDDLRLCASVARFERFQRPLLLPLSRKGFLGEVIGEPDPAKRDAATVGAIMASGLGPASILRIHNVDACWQAVKLAETLSADPCGDSALR